ncbi:protein Mpsnf1.12 [Marchantia polymorpha subsp. ruderalis]|nr:hypothetical protein Mp_2g26680 [Marchantia polymorpha subsp. ruderalis]
MTRGRGPVQVGTGIKVYWDGDDTWYSAEVTDFDPETEWCKVLYEDGEREEFRLSEVKYKRISGGKLRERYLADDAGRFSRKLLHYIHNTLVDMADRLPEFAVRRDSRQWWEKWQANVKIAANSRNLSGLVKLTTTFGEQIKVLDIEGKVDVTTPWWKAQSGEWLAKLKEATNFEDVASRVKDLLLRALDWTAARELFTSTGDTPIAMMDEEETVVKEKESKRKGMVPEIVVKEKESKRKGMVPEIVVKEKESKRKGMVPEIVVKEKESKRKGMVPDIVVKEKESKRKGMVPEIVVKEKESKRKGMVPEIVTPRPAPKEVLRVEADIVGEAPPTGKRRKISKKTLREVTKDAEGRDMEEKPQEAPVIQLKVEGLSKVTKKRRTGDGTKGKSSVQVQKEYRILDSNSHISTMPPCNHIGPPDVFSRGSEGNSYNLAEEAHEEHVQIYKSDNLLNETFVSGTVVGGKKIRGRKKKKLQDGGKMNAGSLREAFFLSEAHVIEKKKKKMNHAASLAEFMHSDDDEIIGRRGAGTVITKELSEQKDTQGIHKGEHLVSNGSSGTKIVADVEDDSETTVSGLKGDQDWNPTKPMVSSWKQKDTVPETTASETRFEVKRKRGRPRKAVSAIVEVGSRVKDHAGLNPPVRPLSFKVAKTQDKQLSDKMQNQISEQCSQIEDSCPIGESEIVVGVQEKQVRLKKRGRPRKGHQPQPVDSQANKMMIGHVVEGTNRCQNVDKSLEDVETVRPRKRGRPRKSGLHEPCPVPLQTLAPPDETENESEECGFLVEPVTQRLLLCAATVQGDDTNVTLCRKEDGLKDVARKVLNPDSVSSAQVNRTDVCGAKVDDVAIRTMVTTLTPTQKKRGRPRKSSVQVECLSSLEATPPPSASPILPSLLKEDNSRNEGLVSYKRRARSYRNGGGSAKKLQKGIVGEHKTQDQSSALTRFVFHDEAATTVAPSVLVSSVSAEYVPEITVGTSATGSSPDVAEDAPLNSSKPVATDVAERKYSRRHFRKSPGRPPRKVVQDESQQISTSPVISQSVTKPVVLRESEPESQPTWTEVRLTVGKDVATGSIYSKGQLFQNGGLPVVVEEQGNGDAYYKITSDAEEAVRPALKGNTSAANNISPRRFKRQGSTPLSIELQHSKKQHGAIQLSVRADSHNDGHSVVATETELVKTGKKRKCGDTGKLSETRTGTRQEGREGIIVIQGKVKNGVINGGVQSVNRTNSLLITGMTSIQRTDRKAGTNEIQQLRQFQAANHILQVPEVAGDELYEPRSQSQVESGILSAPLHGNGNQLQTRSSGDESCASPAHPKSDKPHTEGRQDAIAEPMKNQEYTQEVCVALQPEAEPEYPSWGERLCSDSEDEFETGTGCYDECPRDSNTMVKGFEQEPLNLRGHEESSSGNPKTMERVTAVLEEVTPANDKATARKKVCELTASVDVKSQSIDTLKEEQPTAGRTIGELTVSTDLISQAMETCADKVSNVVSNFDTESGQLHGGQVLGQIGEENTPNQDQKSVPPELVCNICNFKDAEDQMLLCEDAQERGCTCAIHTFCLTPPLQKVPTDAWTCLHCALMATHNKNVKICSPKRFPPKRIQAVIGRRSNLVKDELKRTEHKRMEYLVKWDSFSHKHDTWIDATWFVGERKRYASIFESKHPDLPKIDLSKEIDDTLVDERKPEWLLIDRILKCRGRSHLLNPSELKNSKWNRERIQFLVKWQGLDYRSATWEEGTDSKEMQRAVSSFISRHESAEKELVSTRVGESVAVSINRQPDYVGVGKNSMYAYQIEGLKWLLSNFESRRNVILADEMGLGKTIQTIAFMSCVRNEKLSSKPALVIAPKSTLSGWEQELQLWAPGLNAVVYQGEKDNRLLIRKYEFYAHNKRPLFDVLLTSYELATLDNSLLCKFHWSSIIVDEGHRMRNMRSNLGNVLKEHRAEFRLLLTGTPLQNTLAEFFSLFHFLDPVKYPNPDSAAEEFTEAVDDGHASSADSEKRLKHLSRIQELLKPRMLRRVKNEVPGLTLPGKKIVEISCALTKQQRHLYTAILRKNLKVLNAGVQSGLKRSLNNILTDLKMVCNHPYLFPDKEPQGLKPEEALRTMVDVSGKLVFLEKLLPMLKNGGHRVLLFSQMTKMLDIMEDFLRFMGLSFCRIDGTTSATDRQKLIAEFNHPQSSTFIFLISTRGGGLGINLPSADTVIIYDPDCNSFVDVQAQARAHRIGQEKIVLVYQLVTVSSVEEKILERSRKKLALENSVITSGFNVPNHIKETAADISTILLHGLNNVLDEQHVRARYTQHTNESVLKLLDRSTPGSSLRETDAHGFLGAVQGNEDVSQHAGKEAANLKQGGYGEEWRELLCKLVEQDEKEELGRGKRRRKQVKYSVQQNVDGQEDGQEDDEYNPTSGSDESCSDVSLETEGRKSTSVPRKTADLQLEVGQEEDSRRRISPGPSVPRSDAAGRSVPTSTATYEVPIEISPSSLTSGVSGSFSFSHCRQTGILNSPVFLGVTSPVQMAGSYIPVSGAIYERVISSEGIGIHLNRLIPATGGDIAVQSVVSPLAPGGNNAVLGYTGLSFGDGSVPPAGQVLSSSINTSGAPGIYGLLRDSSLQLAGSHRTSGINNAMQENSGLPGVNESVQSGNSSPALIMKSTSFGHSGTCGRGKSVQVAGPTPGIPSVELGYSSSPRDISVQSACPPPNSYVPPCLNPCVNSAALASSGLLGEICSSQSARPPTLASDASLPPPTTTPCLHSSGPGHSGILTNKGQGPLAGLQSPQCSSNGDIPATYLTRPPGISVPPPEIVASISNHPPVSQAAVPPTTRPVLSSAGLKKSARNRQRHLQLGSGSSVVGTSTSVNPPSAAAVSVLPAVHVVIPPGSQSSQATCNVTAPYHPVVQLSPSEIPTSFYPSSSSTATAVPTLHSTPVTERHTVLTNSVGRVEEESTEQGVTKHSREPSVSVNLPNSGVSIPPIARAQAQRKPLWVPKGDAGLFMGSLRNP